MAQTVVVVGGGFSGALTAVCLLSRSDVVRVTLINTGSVFPLGAAYSTKKMEHILNVPAGKMSAFPSDPSHFVNWIRARPEYLELVAGDLEGAFVPRLIYGKYLQNVLHPYLGLDRLEVLNNRAVAVQHAPGGYRIEMADGTAIPGSAVVLATGNHLPAPPRIDDSDLFSSPRYHANPWDHKYIDLIQADETVLVLGTGLTMIDVACSLNARQFRGNLIAASPRGYLPAPHAAGERVADFSALLAEKDLLGILRVVREQLRSSVAAGAPWQSVIEALRPSIRSIWLGLSPKERRQFMSHLRHIWGVARHRLPSTVHRVVSEMKNTGRLEVIGCRLTSVAISGDEFVVDVRMRKDHSSRRLTVSRIVNCTGPQGNVTKLKDPLFESLLKDGLIVSDPLGLGIRALPDGRVLGEDDTPIRGLYAIGSILRGVLWETTSVPDLRGSAQITAEKVLSDLPEEELAHDVIPSNSSLRLSQTDRQYQ